MIGNLKFTGDKWVRLFSLNMIVCVGMLCAIGIWLSTFRQGDDMRRTLFPVAIVLLAEVMFLQIINALFFLPVAVNRNVPSAISVVFIIPFMNDPSMRMMAVPCLMNYLFVTLVHMRLVKQDANG